MGLSKYPTKLDLFTTKRNAQFEGDPNGDIVMADDVNHLQDAISEIEKALGVNPQGNKLSVGERITLLEGSSSLRVPSFLIYLGAPAKINESVTTLEAAGHFSKYDHVVLGNNAQDPNDSDHQATLEVIDYIRSSKDVKFYGHIDCGVNTLNLSISEIQNQIKQWKDLDAIGIYCANFGFEDRVSRDRQNAILDSIHQYGMVAILDAQNPEEVFTDLFHETMNSTWKKPNIQEGDIYHYNNFALNTSTPGIYEPNQMAAITMLIKLYDYRVNQGIKIFATSVIQTNVDRELAQQYYDYAHVTALVTSMDAFHPVIEGYGAATDTAPTYDWMPIAGSWYMASPRIEYDDLGHECVRELPFGRIFLNTHNHTYRYEGIYIPFELLRIAKNSIEGNLLKDGTVLDKKIAAYSGDRLMKAINSDQGDTRIDIKKIMPYSYNDIDGAVPVDKLSANVIEAINANIGFARIGAAVIGDLTAEHIKSGTIDAGRITASVIEAINLYTQNMTADSATIGEAVIGNLSAEKITAGDIDAERIQAAVIDAINLSARQADIENLNADNITAGNIKAERIFSEVVNAINLYTETMVAGSAKIDVASIGELTAGHIRASVMEAINFRTDNAIINAARIAELSADHIKAAVFEAIDANITNAKIDQAHIGDLSADKITAGTIDADRIKSSVVEALNLYAEELTAGSATLDQALIKELDASKITAGNISADRIQANIVEAINAYVQNMSATSAKIDVGAIGTLTAEHIKGAVIEAINAHIGNATIDAAKIGSLRAENIVAEIIKAINMSVESATIDQAQIGELDASKITTGTLEADRIKSSVIEAVNASIENATINGAKIGTLEADSMKAGVIQAINGSFENLTIDNGKIGALSVNNLKANVIEAVNASISEAKIGAAHIEELTADHIKAAVIEAINAKITNATIDSAVIGELAVDNMKTQVIEAINSYTGVAVIGEGKIGDLSAGKIKTGTLDADRIKASVVNAINASIDQLSANHAKIDAAAIGSLKANNIQAEVVQAINASIENAKIEAAKIADLTADHIEAVVINAINANIGEATIDSAKIGELEADKIKGAVIEALEANIGLATIDEALISTLNANKIQGGQIAAGVLTANVVNAINSEIQNAKIDAAKIGSLKAENIQAEVIKAINASIESATIDSAKISNLHADKITAGDISADRMTANIVSAINTYTENLQAGQAIIDSAAIDVLSAHHMQVAVINAINASVENIKINNAKIGSLSAAHIEAEVIAAINANLGTATIKEGVIEDLSAEKITAGSLKAEVMETNVIHAINGDFDSATINAAKIGELTADHIRAEVIEAINAHIGEATIDSGKIGTLEAGHIKTSVIEAINGSFEGLTIDAAKVGSLKAENISAEIIKAINLTVETMKINSGHIDTLTADHIKTSVITAINASLENVKIGYAKIGALRAENFEAESVTANAIKSDAIQSQHIDAGQILAEHIKADEINAAHIKAGSIQTNHVSADGLDAGVIKTGYLDARRIQAGSIEADRIVAGSITSREIAAKSITAREIQTGSITSDEIAAGSISAEHISTVGLDAQSISVFNGKTGETLIGAGYLRVDGLDSGVVQSDNLLGNGMFMTASSSYGIKRTNPAGEVIIGTESQVPGGNEVWKYDLDTGELVDTIEVPGKKPAFIAIDPMNRYAYITVQGNDTIAQLDLHFDTITENFRPVGKAPTRIKFTGDLLGDMKHIFAVNTDKTDVNAPDSFYVLDVPPHSDFEQFYLHHQFVTGNTPYDFALSEKDKKVYITLADQGDIAVLDASEALSYKWKFVEAIPISPYGTDNYHGGLTAGFGLGAAVGGDASAEYNKDSGHAGHGGGHNHGGYSVSDGTMKEYKPHGIAIDKEENFLLVTEVEQNELVVINRVPAEQFEWPVHPSYEENEEWIHHVNSVIMQYDNNPEQAVADGYTTVSPYVPFMGYHFSNPNPAAFSFTVPNTLMFIFDTTVNQYKIVGAEWAVADPNVPSPVPGKDWELSENSMARYADGLTIPGISAEEAPPFHPETNSPLVGWTPAIYGIHFFSIVDNPLGLFETFNPKLELYNKTQPNFPPGFENLVDPSMPATNYHEYVAPSDGSGVGGDTGGGGGGHHHSVGDVEIVEMGVKEVEEEEVEMSINAVPVVDPNFIPAPNPIEEDHSGHVMGPSPDTTGQGTVYKYVRHRIPVGDDPENVVIVGEKVWVTLLGSNKIAVLNKSDLYRTQMDFTHRGTDWSAYVRYVEVGNKPMDIIPDHERGRLYVTIQGESEIAVVDIETEEVVDRWAAGANVMSGDITPDGKYMYVTNNGGVGELSFVYPDGAYIGDAFIGLEGDVRYQGADKWVPDRSDWVFDNDGTLRSSSSVEFRINEPFLNEGGYVRLAAQGYDGQYVLIEQDVYNVTNYSNGNNFDIAEGDRLQGNQERTLWYPTNKWLLEKGGPTNIKIVQDVLVEDTRERIETIPDPAVYSIHYDTARIEFAPGVIPAGAWVEADYQYRANVWFKNHNGSTLIAIENSSSANFNTFFEIDEFVPKFITLDALQTGPFDYEPVLVPAVTHGHFQGLRYSYKTNRAYNLPEESITLSAPIEDNGGGTNILAPLNNNISSSDYVEVGTGLQSYTIDLGAVYFVPKIKVWHFWQDGRTYHDTKTEVSADGVNWITVFDSAVSGEYQETKDGNVIDFWAYPEGQVPTEEENYLAAKPIRYVRDWINGSTVNGNNHWVEIQVYGDWELENHYRYPEGSANQGQLMSTNGLGFATTTVSQASITLNLPIDFTSWWYMTYLVGPEFGSIEFEMPTAMAGSHVLPLGNPYLNKIAHRHTMSFPPGNHQVIIKQRSGKVSMDRLRFEDFQYFDRSATRIPNTADSSFTRYKIVPENAKDYVGVGNQSTHGPYDTPRVNPDTKQADQSVEIKYRFRVKSVLESSGIQEEQGVAYVTSAIFEQGKLSSHWRPSSSSDFTPGNRIESWDGNHPHNTGIQWFHLANGAIRGTKILPSAIMDYHISPYARIAEYKLDLNHPTHRHGHYMTHADGTKYFMDNKDIIDKAMGWGTSGTSHIIARADHTHEGFVEASNSPTKNGQVPYWHAMHGHVMWMQLSWNDIQNKPTEFNPVYHEHTVEEIADLADNYYDKGTIDAKLAAVEAGAGGNGGGGDVYTSEQNTFIETNTFTKSGTAIVIKPSTRPSTGRKLFSILDNTGADLLYATIEGNTVGTNLTMSGSITGGSLTVTGSSNLSSITTQSLTVDGTVSLSGNLILGAQATTGTQAVRADRTISTATGSGLKGGGALTSNLSLSVDFGGTGSSNLVSRADHTHTDYISKTLASEKVRENFTVLGRQWVGETGSTGSIVLRNASNANAIYLDAGDGGSISNHKIYLNGKDGSATYAGNVRVASLTVDSTSLVRNLNAEFIGGTRETAFVRTASIRDIRGYGVHTGLGVKQKTPTPDMSVQVQPGVAYTDSGRRFEWTAVQSLPVAEASSNYDRYDIVFIQGSQIKDINNVLISSGNNEGLLAVWTGAAGATPVVQYAQLYDAYPNAIVLGTILVRANVGTVTDGTSGTFNAIDTSMKRMMNVRLVEGTSYSIDETTYIKGDIYEKSVKLEDKYARFSADNTFNSNQKINGRVHINASGSLDGGSASGNYGLRVGTNTDFLSFDSNEILSTKNIVLKASNGAVLVQGTEGITLNSKVKAPSSAKTLRIPAGQRTVTFEHGYGSTSYAVSLAANSFERHVRWTSKTANSVVIEIDDPTDQEILVDCILIGY